MTVQKPSRFEAITPITECDVEDIDNLVRFRKKRAEWLEWLIGEDDHSVIHQIWTMQNNYFVFRVINEAQRITYRNKNNIIFNNHFLCRFMTEGFLAMQALMIRRLTDQPSGKPDRQIVSLRRLVQDLSRHQHLFTREIVIGYDGAPFNTGPAYTRWSMEAAKRISASVGPQCWGEEHHTSGPDAWRWAESEHEKIDRLIGVSRGQRHRSDRIPASVFSNLENCIASNTLEKIREFANKRIAHAADYYSRSSARFDIGGMKFDEIDLAHKMIISVAQFISLTLLGQASIGTVPFPQFDAFEFAGITGLDAVSIRRLRRLVDCLAERRARWAQEAVDLVLGAQKLG